MNTIDVQLKGVTKRFGPVTAVNDVSFTINKGEFFSLLGPSGCGKTTLLRIISGFEQSTVGEVYIGGALMNQVAPYRRPTNLVFQHLSLFPHMTVYKNIAFGLEMKGFPGQQIRREVDRMFDLIQLPGYANRKISELSGGQKQRVAIARALVNRPTVLLLDEPLGALDLKLRVQMQLELKRIQREVGTTFIYVTHDQGEAITMSNRIAVMSNGVVEQIGDSDDIYEHPRTVFVAGFIGETNLMEGTVADVQADHAVVNCDGLPIKVPAGDGLAPGRAVHLSIRPEKITIGGPHGAGHNVVNGTVEDTIYQGALTIVRVLAENKRSWMVSVQNLHAKKGYEKGTPVQIGWEIDNGTVISE